MRAPAHRLLGRTSAVGAVDELLEHVRHGESAALVIRGEAGIGKSALLDYAAVRADGIQVLRAAGIETESDLPFAGLAGLLRPLGGDMAELPDTQATALAGALGLAASGGIDRFLVSAAVLSLLAAASEERPLVCLVDDAQWLDQPSADALVFAARRLQADAVGIVFAAREGDPQRFAAQGIADLVLPRLDDDAARALLARGAAGLGAEARARVLTEAAGNPLALVELPTALTAEQTAGAEPLPQALPLTPRLERLFRARIEKLPETTATALVVAAAADAGDLAPVLRAARALGLSDEAFAPAERAGLVHLADGRVRFRHPLVRSAVYNGAPLSERRAAHGALAQAFEDHEQFDRRVWHQAHATLEGDETVAGALEALARRALLRSAHASAASALARAAELTTVPARRAPRLAAAAQAAWDAGQPDRARQLARHALASAQRALRAQLLHLLGVIEARNGDPREALAILLQAAEASTAAPLSLEILHEAAELAADMGNRSRVADFGRRAQALHVTAARDRFSRAALTAFGMLFDGGHDSARRTFCQVLELADELRDDPRAQIWAANTASTVHDLGAGLPFTSRAVEVARGHGRLSILPVALEQHALELLWNSRLDDAYAAAQEGYRLALDMGQGSGWHLAVLAHVEAVRGHEREARENAAQALAHAEAANQTFLATLTKAALGLLELTIGRLGEAAAQLLPITDVDREEIHPALAIRAVPDVIEAIARSDHANELAAAPLAHLRTWANDFPAPVRRALLARCEALLEARPADAAFNEAIALAAEVPTFERARTELLYGEHLRRQRKRTEARSHLRLAAELFHSLRARPWQERAEAELRATGETARTRDTTPLAQLTPQELQISQLVAEGLTNREIATKLYLSPRTIEYHLRKVFAKLGVASRAELIRLGPEAIATSG